MVRSKKRKMRVGVIGYGSQGRAIDLNLRDCGYEVRVGLRPRSKSIQRATDDGLTKITTVPCTVGESEVIVFAFPDHLHAEIYQGRIEKHLSPGQTLLFLAGMSVHFGQVKPPDD